MSADDPTGIRFDRGDLDDTTTRQAGARRRRGFRLTGRVADTTSATAPVNEPGQVASVHRMPPFNLRQLAEQHITAAEQDRRERGAA